MDQSELTWSQQVKKGTIRGWSELLERAAKSPSGFYFTIIQIIEYIEASFSISDRIYGSTFFVATGFHGLHEIIGSIFLLIMFNPNLTKSLFFLSFWIWSRLKTDTANKRRTQRDNNSVWYTARKCDGHRWNDYVLKAFLIRITPELKDKTIKLKSIYGDPNSFILIKQISWKTDRMWALAVAGAVSWDSQKWGQVKLKHLRCQSI